MSVVQHRILAVLAAAGIIAPAGFTAVVIAQGLIHPDYSHVALPISALAAWPSGWIQSVNFVMTGLLMIAFAVGLHFGVARGPGDVIGPALLVLSGSGLMVAGAFPWREVDGAFIVPTGHLVGAVMTFLGAGAGLIALSLRMAGDARWYEAAAYARAGGVVIVVLFLVFGAFARSPGAPLHSWVGLVQRALVTAWFVCTIVLALKQLRMVREADTGFHR